MTLAADAGTLGRNFMGYTVKHASDLIACGVSGIGEVGGAFFQNNRKLIDYERAIDSAGMAVDRGYILTDEDRVRRAVIASLMCTFRVDLAEYDFDFTRELAALRPMADDGLLSISGSCIQVSETGRLFVRNICMEFDEHLRRHSDENQRFSRTV